MLGTESVSTTRMFASIAKYIAGGSVHAEYRLEDMAADTESILDELGVERAHIAGISMGGMIAQVFACRAPHRTVSLTSISSATGNVITGVGNPVAIATGADHEGSTGVAQLFAQRDDVHWHEKRDLQR